MSVRRFSGAVALALGIGAFCASGGARAQIVDDVGEVTPFLWGPVRFYPVVNSSVEWTDNLFYANPETLVLVNGRLQPVEPVATTTSSVSPSFVAELPFGQSRARAGYAYRYNDYSTPAMPTNGAHFFEAELRLIFSNGWVAGFRDDYQNGILDTETFDPGGAIRFSGQKFRANVATGNVGYQGQRVTVMLTGTLNDLTFPPAVRADYYNTDGWSGELSTEYELAKTVKVGASYFLGRTSLLRPLPPPLVPDNRREIEQGVRVGADLTLGPGTACTIRVGRPWWEYRTETRTGFETERFRSLIATVAFRHSVPAGMQITLDLTRDLYPAVFLTTNQYTDERVVVSLMNDLRAKLVLGASTAYYVNRYPMTELPGIGPIRRLDQTFDGSAWIGYRVTGRMEWRLIGRTDRRDSNVRGFGYRTGSIGVTFTLGG